MTKMCDMGSHGQRFLETSCSLHNYIVLIYSANNSTLILSFRVFSHKKKIAQG